MKKDDLEFEDDLRPEYNLRELEVVGFGLGRKRFGLLVRLEPDVANVFQTADSVNEALRSLIRAAKEKQRLPQ